MLACLLEIVRCSPAIFMSERSNPFLTADFPWIGMTIRSRRPAIVKTWWLP
jgi:hypothetical protein